MTHALTAAAEQTGATTLGDRGASYLRTVVPVLWGSVVAQLLAWLAPLLPGDVGAALDRWLSGDAAIALVTAAVIAAWYVIWRKVEPLLPDWLTRLVLGSAAAPTYAKTADDGAAIVTTLDGQTYVGELPAAAAILVDAEHADDEFTVRE